VPVSILATALPTVNAFLFSFTVTSGNAVGVGSGLESCHTHGLWQRLGTKTPWYDHVLYPLAAYTYVYPHPNEANTSLSYPSERILPGTISSLTALTGVNASCKENDSVFVSDSIILN
jgi:hypothetical protein